MAMTAAPAAAMAAAPAAAVSLWQTSLAAAAALYDSHLCH